VRYRFATGLLACSVLASSLHAGSYLLTADAGDHGIGEGPPPFVTAATGNTIRVGANNNATPGGRNAVLVFPLPALPAGDGVLSAQLVFTVSGRVGSPTFNGDLWGIGFQAGTSPLLKYFEADEGDAGNAKLADNVLTPTTSAGPVVVNCAGLTDYVRDFYTTNLAYDGGTYLFLRLNPDADAGTGSLGWGIYTAETVTNAATLTLVTTNATGQANAGCTNFIVIVTDDQRWDALGVVQREMGAAARFPWFTNGTPNLDRLAAEGIRFRNAFLTLSLCSPSRAAIQTGRYNHLNGVINNSTPFPTNSVTFATQLREAGYTTAWVGKWHHGQQVARPGYDFAASYLGQGNFFDTTFYVNGVATPTVGWVDDVATDYALAFIQTNQHKPFALVVGYKTTHGPRTPPERTANLYTNETALPVPNLNVPVPWATNINKPGAEDLRNYFRCITAMDDAVGRIMDRLEVTGLATNTMVIFCGDNGYYLGEHGRGDKRSAYEESIRIPVLVRYPKLIPQPSLSDELVLHLDFATTILDLAGVPIPCTMQGASWRPLFAGNTNGWRQSFFYQYFLEPNFNPPTLFAMRTTNAKLVLYPGHPEWSEMFDLAADPHEINNLYALPEHAAMRASLRVEFDRLAAETGLSAILAAPVKSGQNRTLQITGGVGPRYEIESATELVGDWTPFSQVKMTSFQHTLADTNTASAPGQFYRARMIAD
jgi:arylsulfatase A-like enzyme